LFLSSAHAEGVFEERTYRLLKTIEEEGSIRRAATRLNRGYRKAWGDIKQAEAGVGHALVTKLRGGRGGGTTTLTEFGHGLVRAWEAYRRELSETADRAYDRHLRPLVGPRLERVSEAASG